VLQSLFLAAIGEARDQGARGLEAFSYRYPEGESSYERFRVHKTVFPQDFLADLGFGVVRAAGRIGLARLELGGLQPVVEGTRDKVLRVVKEAIPAGAAASAAATLVSTLPRGLCRARARRSGSRSARPPCAGCRSRGRARGPARRWGRGECGRRATSSPPAALPGDGKSSTRTDSAAPSSSRARSAESARSVSIQIASA